MRRTLLITLITLACALALCTLVHLKVNRLVVHARHLRTRAIEAMDQGDVQAAEEGMTRLAAYIGDHQGWLELVCDHADLHELKLQIIDARAAIEFGIEDDFYQAIYRFGEGVDHIAGIEKISLGNLY